MPPCVGRDEEEAGGAARKVGRPRETTARVILKGGFFSISLMVGIPREVGVVRGGRGGEDGFGLYGNAIHRMVYGPAHQHCLRAY